MKSKLSCMIAGAMLCVACTSPRDFLPADAASQMSNDAPKVISGTGGAGNVAGGGSSGGAGTSDPTDGPPSTSNCPAGQNPCAGTCVDAKSLTACGSSCTRCPTSPNGTTACDGDKCALACEAGFHRCDAACVSDTDPLTCGPSCKACPVPTGGNSTCDGTSCGTACPMNTQICSGRCAPTVEACSNVCTGGQKNCSGSCVAPDDVNFCDACKPCKPPANADPTCVNGACGFQCKTGFHKCGTVCNDNTSILSCGTGATACAACPVPANGTPSCNGIACDFRCETGFRKCGTMCVAADALCNGACGPGFVACEGGCKAMTALSAEVCDGHDNDCNGRIDDLMQACGSATGNCKKGVQTCTNGVWGTCSGGVAAAAKDACSPVGDDANCNGVPNEGCDCTVGQTRPCARCGTQTCDATGKWPATCAGSKECEVGEVKTDSIACGNCGMQSRNATCSPACTYGAWTNVGSCVGSGPCAPGVTADQTQNIACGNCGTQRQTRACTAACNWPATWTNSGTCTGSGCLPASTQAATSQPCGYCGEQLKEQVCSNSCAFGAPVDKGACIQNECNTMPGDERVGYVTCFWPDPNFHTVCLPSQKCCLSTAGSYACQTACAATDKVNPCDGPEDCGGSQCCSQFDANENSYSYCTTSCQFNIRCHADVDCPATFHCSKFSTTADYRNGVCYPPGGPP
jgi:hypothetical protein